MTIVVTGATGHLGSLIVEGLLGTGLAPADIVGTGRKVEKLDGFAARGVTVRQIDFDDPASLDAAFAGADSLMLVSASEPGNRVPQHIAAIDAAKRAGVKHIVYTSAPAATTSALVLAPEHKATEEYLVASGIPFTILRNGWYTENYFGTLAQAKATGVIAQNTGDGRVASASRKDYADAAVVALTQPGHEGKVYELSGDVAWDFDDFAKAASEVTGREVTYQRLTADEAAAALAGAGLDDGTIGFVVALNGNISDGLLSPTSGELRELIGRPTTPFQETLATA
jgi:NAD(P)H dehydrogenase (quinone)